MVPNCATPNQTPYLWGSVDGVTTLFEYNNLTWVDVATFPVDLEAAAGGSSFFVDSESALFTLTHHVCGWENIGSIFGSTPAT